MLDQVLDVFNVKPEHDLHVMRPRQTLFDITSDVLLKIRKVLEYEEPDCVLVHGDTTTSFRRRSCRVLPSNPCRTRRGRPAYTQSLFSMAGRVQPSSGGRDFAVVFRSDGGRADRTCSTRANPLIASTSPANTGIDALRYTVREGYSHPELDWVGDSRLILITAHRRENLGEPMHRMFRAIRRVMEERPDTKAIYPIHMNPQVRSAAHEELDGFDRLRIVDPLEVMDFHNFMARSHLIPH